MMSRIALFTYHCSFSKEWFARIITSILMFYLFNISLLSVTLAQTSKEEYRKQIQHTTSPLKRIELALKVGDIFLEQDDVETAVSFYTIASTESKISGEEILYADSLVKIADLEPKRNIARFQYLKAKEIYENTEGENEELADTIEKLVWTYDVLQKDTTSAIQLLTDANQLRKALPFTTKYTENIRALGWLNEYIKDFSQAEKYYTLAVELDIKHLGFDDIRTVLSMENLAQYYINHEKYKQAVTVLKRKRRLHRNEAFPDTYNLGRTESMLGWCYLQLKDYKNAEFYFQNALKNINISITKDVNTPHYYSLPALFDLVYFYTDRQDFTAAEPYYNTAKQILYSAGEGDIIEYLKHAEIDQTPQDGIEGFPWSIKAQIHGVQAMDYYLKSQ